MKTMFKILVALCLLCFVLGFAGLGSEMIVGFSRAIAAVLFCLAFITKVIEKAEAEA